MKAPNLRQFFKPVQPAVQAGTGDVRYMESMPHPRLTNFVYCYWQLKSCHRLSSPLSYRVIPDGCIDIFFDKNNLTDSRIMGFTSKPTEFELGSTFEYIGVRFMPAAVPYIYKVDASVLTEKDESLSDVLPLIKSQLADRLFEADSFNDIVDSFDRYFLRELERTNILIDKRLDNALDLILRQHGDINLSTDIDTGISARQLRRLFEFYIGDTPKAFCKVVRFQHFFKLSSTHKSVTPDQYLDAGYYDQPHFNKEFKSLFGLTPTQVFPR